MITLFPYNGHMCEIVEIEHDGYMMYGGFVDYEQVCWDQPTEAEARRAVVYYVRNKSQNAAGTDQGLTLSDPVRLSRPRTARHGNGGCGAIELSLLSVTF
jgi:hypothetical protein